MFWTCFGCVTWGYLFAATPRLSFDGLRGVALPTVQAPFRAVNYNFYNNLTTTETHR